jgi:hypothetical protein
MTFTARAENKKEEEWSARNATYKGPSQLALVTSVGAGKSGGERVSIDRVGRLRQRHFTENEIVDSIWSL